jgi:Immunity protein 26
VKISIKKPEEGDLFAIQIGDERFAVAVMARVEKAKPRKPYGIFVYFFGPYGNPETAMLESDPTIRSDRAIARLQTSALDIYSGEWKRIGHLSNWNRDAWPFPDFYQYDMLTEKMYRVRLNEWDLLRQVEREVVNSIEGLDKNSLHGSGSASNHAAKLMKDLPLIDAHMS